jgi:hypothetical protein
MQREHHHHVEFGDVGAPYRPPTTSQPDSQPDDQPPRRNGRVVTSAVDGVRWTVYEMAGEAIPGCRGASCLVFDSPGCVRRVWRFPDDWRHMPDDALLRVSLGR